MARSLPLETLLHIFSFLKEDLVACASVCREWQVAAEKTTFGHLLANSENLEDLRRIVGHTSTPWRPCFVKKLDFKCILPAYSVKARARYENEDDRRSNDISFTQAITSLFDVLSSWSADYRCEIELVIYARSLSDFESEPDWNKRKIRSQRGIAFPEEDLLQARYRSSYLQLTEKAHISTANCVVGLRLLGVHYRDVSPQSASEIVSRLPRLRTLSADLSDSGGKCLTTRDQLRNGFAQGIIKWSPSLKNFRLLFPGESWDESRPLERSKPGADLLSLALHRLSQQLETIDLWPIMIGPELFWPQHAGNQTPYWPNLTEINLKYAPATPSGTWLFERDPRWKDLTPDYDDDPPRADGPGSNAINRFRTVANGDINELYVAAGLAAQQMPRLRNMTLCADIRDSGEGLGPVIDGDIQHWFKYNSRLARVTWVSNTKFHVAPEVREVWNAVAQSHGHDHVTIENLGFRLPPDDFNSHMENYDESNGFDEVFKEEFGCFSWDA